MLFTLKKCIIIKKYKNVDGEYIFVLQNVDCKH